MAQRERMRSAGSVDPLGIALGLLSGAVVYASYHPSDSIAVEKGDALWFAALSVVIGTVTWATAAARRTGGAGDTANLLRPVSASDLPVATADECCAGERTALDWADRLLDIVPWMLAGWMLVAALASSPPGNLRVATNEAWLWVSAAAVFTAARRLFPSPASRQAMLGLIVVCATGLAVHGLHQQWISLPKNRADYREDPEALLRMAGIEAPPGSAERMVFENRLFDGGPTGTFALANSLAAVLAAGLVISAGLLRFRWSHWQARGRAAGGTAALLCAACLFATRSRSGILAALLGIAVVLALASLRRRGLAWKHRWAAAAAGAALLIVGGVVAAAVGGREFLQQAPASLAFRLQYWRSTLKMAFDRPWFAAGPGNFQAIYEQYREPSASEQIAEPHNFLFETLASGGFVALAMLLVVLASAAAMVVLRGRRAAAAGLRSRQQEPATMSQATADEPPGADTRWVVLGAGLALVLVWLIGFATGQVPDFDAHLLAIPVAVAVALGLFSSHSADQAPRLSHMWETDMIAGSALFAVLTHLLVAGGWTVPGVAVVVWVLAAMLCPATGSSAVAATSSGRAPTSGGNRQSPSRWPAGAVAIGGLLLLIALRLVSIGPVQASASAMSQARAAQAHGQFDRTEAELRRALQADPWSTEPAIWLADLLHWKLVISGDTVALRQQWSEAIQELERRAGKNPAVYREVARQQLHVYQRHGRDDDLAAALETLQTAAGWAPAHQKLAAQLAVTADAAGREQVAQRAAERAVHLSGLGNNIERALSRQYILVAQHIGEAARRGPELAPADRLLANRLSAARVQASD